MTYRRRRGLGGRTDGVRTGGAGGGGPRAGGTAEGPGSRRPPERARRWLVAAVVLGVCFVAGYAIAAAWFSPEPAGADAGPLVEVPELVGLDRAEARERVEEVGLTLTIRAGISHPRAPEGAVLAQTPLPGQLARPGAPVYATLSRGPETHVLPDVAGFSERQATIVLEGLGYGVHSETREASADRGTAVGTVPPPGTRLPVPSDVRLLVSAGPPVVSVPDLTGLHVDDVEERLAEVSLELGAIRYDPLAYEAPRRVIGQYPPAGYRLREGGAVEIRVAGRPAADEDPSGRESGGASGVPPPPTVELL